MTVIEMVVVIGIFATITGTILFNYRSFSSGVSLQNLAQEIALQGKRAQTLASQGRFPTLSQAQLNIGDANFLPQDWVSSYGIAFNIVQMPKSFVFYFNSPRYYVDVPTGSLGSYTVEDRNTYFEDFVNSSYVTCGEQTSECVEEIQITDGSFIDLICLASEPSQGQNCEQGERSEKLHISFTRPYLDARIFGDDASVSQPYGFIRVTNPDGSQRRFITFWKTGQISVN